MGVTSRESLKAICENGQLYQTPSGPILDWIRSNQTRDARELSLFALLALRTSPGVVGSQAVLSQFESFIPRVDPSLGQLENHFEEVLAWGRAWCYVRLPGFL